MSSFLLVRKALTAYEIFPKKTIITFNGYLCPKNHDSRRISTYHVFLVSERERIRIFIT